MDKTIAVHISASGRWFHMALFLVAILSISIVHAQPSSEAFVPCQEMPDLMQHYHADYEALVRFYNGAFYGTRQEGNYNTAGGSPEKGDATTSYTKSTCKNWIGSISTGFHRSAKWTGCCSAAGAATR